ncbi:hypothetical protein NCC78_28880, partial [Micromonospora phytophila]|nr:hypothetical protein [Micromonospora phytophila]
MRQEEHPEAVRSAPVRVPPPEDRVGRADVPEDALDDRGTFDDPAVAGERTSDDRDADERTDGRDNDGRRPEFHEPGPVPTAFGATTVGGAVAASALASPYPEDEPDPRTESTARPGDGAVDGPREGRRADPTAGFHRAGHDEIPTDDDPGRTGGATVLPPDATDGRPERRSDLTGWAGDPDATAGAA